ncbi:inhibitor of trypsin and hageman factor-like [Dorcoceras hygrometricum]|uniref:Inhibitor of trypsin and hageman factor-like n=1 Tax=Dorcoceras hygrometricum TaxID=472368 RepID=A0A2Z7ASI2_9LAMI|nr:inhibitor of trypsin and hageman factor-like [Dorcoceras hygrometricum]
MIYATAFIQLSRHWCTIFNATKLIYFPTKRKERYTNIQSASQRCRSVQARKLSWPELVGKDGHAAAEVVERENPNVRAIVLKDGTPVTKDFRCDRVWVWVNDKNRVVRPPTVG